MTLAAEIPVMVHRIARDGAELSASSLRAAMSDPALAQGFEQVRGFIDFVTARAPEALDQARSGYFLYENGVGTPPSDLVRGVTLIIDDAVTDIAHGGNGTVTVGRGGGKLLIADPLYEPVILGHELLHALESNITGNPYTAELDADLVGLAFARDRGWGPAHERPWDIAGLRDLSTPRYPTMSALLAGPVDDFHHTGDPIAAAITRAAERIGVDELDLITVDAALRPLPNRQARVEALFQLENETERVRSALTSHAQHIVDAAERVFPSSQHRATLAAELRASEIHLT